MNIPPIDEIAHAVAKASPPSRIAAAAFVLDPF